MSQTNRFALTLETLAELAPQIRAAHADPKAGLPSLSEALSECSPLPQSALFLGLAGDGLPILLNLQDPLPGPLLIVGDPGSGKTALLKNIARSVDRSHDPSRVKYAALTGYPAEWDGFENSAHCEGILPLKEDQIKNYLSSLVEWARINKNEGQYLLLIIDGLDVMLENAEVHQSLRWLLLRGTARNIWPLITLNARQAGNVSNWLEAFRTRLFGFIQNDADAETLTGLKSVSFQDLLAGSQFSIREGGNWLPFWIPNLD